MSTKQAHDELKRLQSRSEKQKHQDLKRKRSRSTVANAVYVAKLATGEIKEDEDTPQPKKANRKLRN